ncbi:MAG: AraC family ligand binding domain-containing protein [Elainella sp.]
MVQLSIQNSPSRLTSEPPGFAQSPRGKSAKAEPVPKQAPEQAKFWRDPALHNLELLRATYVTHCFARHTHDSYAIGVIEAGVEEFFYLGSTHRATPNCIVNVHPGEPHNGHAGVPDGWKYRMFYPEVSLLQQALAELTETDCQNSLPYFPSPVIQDEALAGQLRRLHRSLEASDTRLERDSRFLWAFAQLVLRHAEQRPWIKPVQTEALAIQQALDYLQAHYAQSVSLDQLAQIAQLKPLRLLRVFQRTVGLPPHAYLVQLRVAQAKQLLAQGAPIAQVAYDTGFTDQSHLNRHFKRAMGVTPGQYAAGCEGRRPEVSPFKTAATSPSGSSARRSPWSG